jgi:hypothetical protein
MAKEKQDERSSALRREREFASLLEVDRGAATETK